MEEASLRGRPAVRTQGVLDGAHPVRWAFTDRRGGVSAPPYDTLDLASHVGDVPAAVAANRGRVAAAVGVPAARLVVMAPVHGTAVAVVDGPAPDEVPGVDALVTAAPGLALLALAADCVPLLLADPVAGVVAAVHAGWRGVAGGVAQAALAAMRDLGARPADTTALLGPAICGACYAVDDARAALVAAVRPECPVPAAGGGRGLDLRAGLAAALRGQGVAVVADGSCTAEDPRLYSYRRDGRTGRQGGAVALRGRPAGAAAAGPPP